MSSAEYSCKLFKPIFAYRQTVWIQIRLLLEEQSDLGPHCLQNWLLKSQADDKADDNCYDWRFKGLRLTVDLLRHKSQQIALWNISLIFPIKQSLIFHAKSLLKRQFAWNVKPYFQGKIRKLSSNYNFWFCPKIGEDYNLYIWAAT